MYSKHRKHVLIFAGGGLGHVSGGVGTLLRHLITAWSADAAALPVRVIDTRGAGGALSGALVFARACSALARARALGIPVVLHLHGADFFDFHASLPRPMRALLRLLMSTADSIVVIGSAWRGRLIAEFGFPPGRVRVVPNGVPACPRAEPGVDTPHILFLGRIGPRKGVGDLIDALASPGLAQRSWRATIAGDGEDAAYRARVASAGLQARIHMPGWQSPEQAAALLAGAAILVLPSNHEVMPMSVLEAMASGVAVITTPVGVIPEILRDGISARLVAPGAPGELAAALAELLDDPGERARLAAAAHQVWARRLDIAVTAAAIQAIYAEAAEARGGRIAGAAPVAA